MTLVAGSAKYMSLRMSYDRIAKLIKEGFDHVDQRFHSVEQRLSNLERGQENILLRLDQHAHRFELDELDRRVTSIERQLPLAE